jgi:hypothetical protein
VFHRLRESSISSRHQFTSSRLLACICSLTKLDVSLFLVCISLCRLTRRLIYPPYTFLHPNNLSRQPSSGSRQLVTTRTAIFPYDSIPFHFTFVLFHSTTFYYILYYYIPLHSTSFHSVPFRSIPFHSVSLQSHSYFSYTLYSIPYFRVDTS